ncbi:RluA family pseudouridine synthase [Peptococcaceae bacterium]|nr:RluA family pseudouridine synthase [Peptococcaceae bacterium]
MIQNIIVGEREAGARIDKFLALHLEDFTRTHIQKLIDEGAVKVNDKIPKPSYKVQAGDEIVVTLKPLEEPKALPENIPLDIYFEDEYIIVVNKPAGMPVHPATGNYSGTLVNALMYHCKDLSGIGGVMRPGIVHRIDKDTTGLLVIAKNDQVHLNLAKQFEERRVVRCYYALVHGNIKNDKGMIDAPIGRDKRDRKKMAVTNINAKPAITYFEVERRFGRYTLIRLKLKTGRTHQIRVHMSYIKHPVVGDEKYGGKTKDFKLDAHMLHAYMLGFKHPVSERYMEFKAPFPEHFKQVLDELSCS